MKTLKTIIYLLLILQSSSIIFADADTANPAKTQKPCGFPDDMNCFENRQIADAEMVNANFKALLETNKKLIKFICNDHPFLDFCPDTKTFTNSIGMTFVEIPAGKFLMGIADGNSVHTQHWVTISKPFFMQTTEITQGQWKKLMGKNPSFFSSCGDNCPVENISWYDVQEFIEKINEREPGTYRLPTEAEWEYSARAGTETLFFFGDCLLTSQANYNPIDPTEGHPIEGCPTGMKIGKTLPVASFSHNSWGLYDMHGNVWEWCQDWFNADYYSTDPVFDPIGPSSGTTKVNRGGGWPHGASHCIPGLRGRDTPESKKSWRGARLVYLPIQQIVD
jgi:formylglycine-generating enzyme required for sulfatase activity